MELRHLRSFVAVAEERHFGRAAARLHLAQPPLSQQIKQLEADLGVTLLARSTRRVDLTPAGSRYLDRAREILAALDAAGTEATRVAAGEIGHLSIGFTGGVTYALLPALTRLVRAELPGVTLDVRGEMLSPDMVAGLLDRRLDLAFLRPDSVPAELRVRPLRRERLVAVLPEGHRLAPLRRVRLSDLAAETFVCHPSGRRSTMYGTVMGACERAGFTPADVIEVAETSTLVTFVAAGLGVGLVPESVRHLQVTGAVYRPLTGAAETVELALATRADQDPPLLERVLALARRVWAT